MAGRNTEKFVWNNLYHITSSDILHYNINTEISEEVQDIFYNVVENYRVIGDIGGLTLTGRSYNNLCKLFVWLQENCSGDVWYYQLRFWFKNDDDIVIFKLRWQ